MVLATTVTTGRAQVSQDYFILLPIGSQSVPITVNKITCISFPVSVQPAGKGSRDVLAQRVKGTENVLMLKAARADFAASNLAVVGSNGRVYSIVLRYEAEPTAYTYRVLDQDSGYSLQPNGPGHPVLFSGETPDPSLLSADADTILEGHSFLHCAAHSEGLRMVMKSIYLKDGYLWLKVRVVNHSLLDYHADFVRFTIQDTRRARRTAIQEKVLVPLYSTPGKTAAGGSAALFVFAFRPFTVLRHKVLVLQVGEHDGGRLLELSIKSKTILRTRAWHTRPQARADKAQALYDVR